MISCLVLDNVYIYIVLLHFTVYYLAFYKFIIQVYVNFLILLLYQAKSRTMDVLILNRYYYYYYYYYYYHYYYYYYVLDPSQYGAIPKSSTT